MQALPALLCVALVGGCERAAPAAPIVSIPVAPLPGIAQVPASSLVFEGPQASPKPGFGQIEEYYDVQAVPGSRDEPAVIVVPTRVRGRLRDAGLSIVPLRGEWFDVSRNADGKRWLTSLALLRGSMAGQPITRIVSVNTGDKYDSSSLYYTFAPWPVTQGVTLESRVAERGAKITHSCKLLTGFQQDARLFTVGDGNGDQEDDCLLLAGTGGEAILISGRDLSTLGEFSIGGDLGNASCVLSDMDGDRVNEVFFTLGVPEPMKDNEASEPGAHSSLSCQRYRVFSPGKHLALIEGRIVRSAEALKWVQSATQLSPGPTGQIQIVLHIAHHDDRSDLVVIEVGTGDPSDIIETPGGYPPRFCRPASGHLAGVAGRRWIAWSAETKQRPLPRLFVAEIGAAGSTIEIVLPADGRRYADCICAFPMGPGGGDGLAVTAGASWDGIERPGSPVLFLDVARLFEKR